ncbi:MAG: phosphatase PAP2 family protein [Chitinophagaceae bacterium]|nr:phosphatase PAP2 family protein [Chitinophagaceae bacterium]
MKKQLRMLAVMLLLIPAISFSQQKDTLIKKLDSLSRKTDSAGTQVNNINPAAYNKTTGFTFSNYFILLGSDLKQEFTKPFHMTRKNWGKVAKFALVTGGLAFADEPIQQQVLKLRSTNPGLNRVSNFVTSFGGLYETYTLAAFGAYGFIFKQEKMKATTLLATQAYLVGGALEVFIKSISGRTRPAYYSPNAEAEPKFYGPLSSKNKDANGKSINTSFPSGHTTVAFAAATVFALEYRNKPFIPLVAYSAATLIGLSRIYENKHWATDVAVGAAIGYLAGKNVVDNYHRYMKIKQPDKYKRSVSFSLHPFYGKMLPAVTYKF